MRVYASLGSSALSLSLLLVPATTMARIIDGAPTPPTARELSQTAYRTDEASSSVPTWFDMDEDETYTLEDMVMADGSEADSMIYPPMGYGSGVSVDVSVSKEVTPDSLSLSAYCDAGVTGSRAEVKAALKQMVEMVKQGVGTDGKVRRSGGYSIYPSYDPMTGQNNTSKYTGNVSLTIEVLNVSASERLLDLVEEQGCSVSWNAMLKDTQSLEREVLEDLMAKLEKRKEVYEKVLKADLDKVVGASLYTYVDGWSTFDADTNTAMATVTLTVTFEPSAK
jgi:predicted secreted protein